MIKKISHFLIVSVLLTSVIEVSAQTNDSLSLNAVLTQVLANFPAIKKNLIEQAAADARIGMAKTAYLPDVSVNASYVHIDPVPTMEMALPGLPVMALKFSPANIFNSSIDIYETIYDFGKTKNSIDFVVQSKNILSLSAEQIKQKLSLGIVNIYYAMVFLQEAVKIKDEQLKTLNEHLKFVEKKKETGSATQYEVLTTKVRISTIENQKTDLLSSLKVQICQLNSLLGQPEKTT